MEQGFKIAIWMLCLIGYLQANPVTRSSVNTGDLGISFLRDVKCGNKTFTSPTNVQESCRHEALKHLMGQLEIAHKQCNGGKERIGQTLETLDVMVKPLVPTNNSTCKLETNTSQFQKLVDAIEKFVQGLNSNPTSSGK